MQTNGIVFFGAIVLKIIALHTVMCLTLAFVTEPSDSISRKDLVIADPEYLFFIETIYHGGQAMNGYNDIHLEMLGVYEEFPSSKNSMDYEESQKQKMWGLPSPISVWLPELPNNKVSGSDDNPSPISFFYESYFEDARDILPKTGSPMWLYQWNFPVLGLSKDLKLIEDRASQAYCTLGDIERSVKKKKNLKPSYTDCNTTEIAAMSIIDESNFEKLCWPSKRTSVDYRLCYEDLFRRKALLSGIMFLFVCMMLLEIIALNKYGIHDDEQQSKSIENDYLDCLILIVSICCTVLCIIIITTDLALGIPIGTNSDMCPDKLTGVKHLYGLLTSLVVFLWAVLGFDCLKIIMLMLEPLGIVKTL